MICRESVADRTVLPYERRECKFEPSVIRRFLENNDPRELRNDLVNGIRNILAALHSARDVEGIIGPPGWRVHQLVGDRKGTWSVSVSGNWRITFEVDGGEIVNLDLEDYH